MSSNLRDRVVVITGASSGIGQATALAFAREGVRLAICARRAEALEETAEACRALGVEVLAVPLDVADEGAVEAFAAQAESRFGGVDVWFNNAALEAFGEFEQIPPAVFERVIQVNLLGTVHGSRAALPRFRRRGSGVLINNGSIVGVCPTPFHSAYVTSKFAIRGFTLALRQEMEGQSGIHVCSLLPASIDTPFWQRGANYSGRAIKPLDPVHPVEQAAGAAVALALNPQREVFAGATGWVLSEQYAANPGLTETLVTAYAGRSLFQDAPAPPSDGVVFDPASAETAPGGGWMRPDTPGLPAGDLPALVASPAILAMGPALYAMNLSAGFFRQWGVQAAAFSKGATTPAS